MRLYVTNENAIMIEVFVADVTEYGILVDDVVGSYDRHTDVLRDGAELVSALVARLNGSNGYAKQPNDLPIEINAS